MNISESIVVITGGAKGFGRSMAEQLLDEVQKVIVIDKDGEGLDDLKSVAPEIDVHKVDLTDHSAVTELAKTLFDNDKSNCPNVLINNAGMIHSAPLINLLDRENMIHDPGMWEKTIDVNLNTVFNMGSAFAGQMALKRRKGVIINISSISAAGNMGQSAYSAAKSAINALTMTWAKELGALGIRSAAIAPGFFDTPSTNEALSEAQVKKWKNQVPLRRLGKPEELVSAVRFIMENDYFNGKVLEIDGGLTI